MTTPMESGRDVTVTFGPRDGGGWRARATDGLTTLSDHGAGSPPVWQLVLIMASALRWKAFLDLRAKLRGES